MLTTLVTILVIGALFVVHSVRISRAEQLASRQFLITQASLWAVSFPMLLGVHFRTDWHPAEAFFEKSLWDPAEWMIAFFAWIVYGFATAAVAEFLSELFERSGRSMQHQNQLVREASALMQQLTFSAQQIELSVTGLVAELTIEVGSGESDEGSENETEEEDNSDADETEPDADPIADVNARTLSILSLQIQTALLDAGLLEHGSPSDREKTIRSSAVSAVYWWRDQCRERGVELSSIVQTAVFDELVAMWSSVRPGLSPSVEQFYGMIDKLKCQIPCRSRKNPSDDPQAN